MAIQFSPHEIVETIRMVQMENLDIRTITMGISLRDCAHPDVATAAARAYNKVCSRAERLVRVGEEIEREYGIPVINKRVSVTPIALIAESCESDDYTVFAEQLDRDQLEGRHALDRAGHRTDGDDERGQVQRQGHHPQQRDRHDIRGEKGGGGQHQARGHRRQQQPLQ